MKTKLKFTATISAFFILHSAFGQGALTPPGAPAPAMKTLAQIEPRTDVLALPTGTFGAYSITQPGSYYLSANIVGGAGVSGIEIKTNDVTIDLGGFTLIGTGGIRGVFANGNNLQRIAVRNGKITGYTYGIDCAGVLGTNHSVTVENVQLVGFSGTGGVGITGGNGMQVRQCQISSFSGLGGAALTAGNTAQLTDLLVQNNYAGIAAGSNSLFARGGRPLASEQLCHLGGIRISTVRLRVHRKRSERLRCRSQLQSYALPVPKKQWFGNIGWFQCHCDRLLHH